MKSSPDPRQQNAPPCPATSSQRMGVALLVSGVASIMGLTTMSCGAESYHQRRVKFVASRDFGCSEDQIQVQALGGVNTSKGYEGTYRADGCNKTQAYRCVPNHFDQGPGAFSCGPDAAGSPSNSPLNTHEPGLYSGDYVRASQIGGRRSPTPQLVYLSFVGDISSQLLSIQVRQQFDGSDDDSVTRQSWLPYSLDRAFVRQPRAFVTLSPLVSQGPTLELRKNRILASLEEIFYEYNVYFTTDMPIDGIFGTEFSYSTVYISASSSDIVGMGSVAPTSYSPWDPGNQRSQEIAFVFDNAALNDGILAVEIAHAVGHILGLEDVVEGGSVMSSSPAFRAPVWGKGLVRAGATQDDVDVLARAVGMWFWQYPFVSEFLPPTLVSAPSPTLGGSGLGSAHSELQAAQCHLQNVAEGEEAFDLFYLCGPDYDGPWVGRHIFVPKHNPPTTRPRGYAEKPGTGQGAGAGGGGIPSLLPFTVEPIEKPVDNETRREFKRGQCRVDGYQAIAAKRFKNYRAVFKPGQRLGVNETNCVDFTQNYTETVTGRKLDSEVKREMGVVVDKKSLGSMILRNDPAIRGPQTALTKIGLAKKVDSLADAMPGDLVQIWWQNGKGGWSGHQVIVKENVLLEKLNGRSTYHVEFVGAQMGKPVGGTFALNVDAKAAQTEQGPVKFFVARLKHTSDAPMCPE